MSSCSNRLVSCVWRRISVSSASVLLSPRSASALLCPRPARSCRPRATRPSLTSVPIWDRARTAASSTADADDVARCGDDGVARPSDTVSARASSSTATSRASPPKWATIASQYAGFDTVSPDASSSAWMPRYCALSSWYLALSVWTGTLRDVAFANDRETPSQLTSAWRASLLTSPPSRKCRYVSIALSNASTMAGLHDSTPPGSESDLRGRPRFLFGAAPST